MPEFVQFDPLQRCPACGGVHQADVTPAGVIECQPALYDATTTCPRTGREILLRTTPTGRVYSRPERFMLQREMAMWRLLLGEE
jgi:hypothetical protein